MNFEDLFMRTELHWPLNPHCQNSKFMLFFDYNFQNNDYLLILIANKMLINVKEIRLNIKINNFNPNLAHILTSNVQFICKSAIVFKEFLILIIGCIFSIII